MAADVDLVVVVVGLVTICELVVVVVVVDVDWVVELIVMVDAVLVAHHRCHLQRGVADRGHSCSS